MEVNIFYGVAVLLAFLAPFAHSEDLCQYMVQIPRPDESPEFPDVPFDGQWNQRPLLPPTLQRPEVCVGTYSLDNNIGQQIIYMEEEIEGDVVIARLNYDGTGEPSIILPLILGAFNLLMPEIRRENDEWLLVITRRQDYETPGMQRYHFFVDAPGHTVRALVTLMIVNIDDNAPIIHAVDSCTVPELGEAGLTECVYEVTDIDGEISTRFMRFSVLSNRGDQDIFYMSGGLINNVWHRMYMTVAINRPLNFVDNPLHIFTVMAEDSLPNNATVTMVVQVQNVDHRPPRWVEIFPMQRFNEKTTQQFTVRALDGDTDIDNPIQYILVRDEEDTFFSLTTIDGGHDGAILHVDPIDRDALEREMFQLKIVAYKANNESLYTDYEIVIIVDDINDQRPMPLEPLAEYRIEIEEETPLTLNLENFGFHDRDLGEHAQYSVEIVEAVPSEAISAFYISPQEGYQRQTFFMGTQNHNMLDYEVDKFRNIVLTVMATDLNNTDFKENATVYIDLINWNDEEPIFEKNNYTFSFKETVPKDFHIGRVRAHDRDIDDRVEHLLMGNAVEYLRIDIDTGDLYVAIDNAFDYHRQSVLFIQVRADDTLGEPYHTRTAQVVIELEDVNNTPPTLQLPRVRPDVEENVPAGHLVVDNIRATDPDTTAHLEFEIVWADSWATKQGRLTPAREYQDCVAIETVYENDNKGIANGILTVKEIRHNVTIDYEEFEVLNLAIRVRDLNTVYGDDYDEAIFTINIIDMNDNGPVFASGSLDQQYRVREMSAAGTVVGSVLATDIDGPLYNQIHYMIQPTEDTPNGLLTIDPQSGQITVDANEAIDADEPPRQYLSYTVIASDKCIVAEEECPPDRTYWNEEIPIRIEIIDTNNKYPVAETGAFETELCVWENVSSGYEIVQLVTSDLDRDDIYHTVRYQINYAWNVELRKFFEVDLDTGWVVVNYTTDEQLDRDRGEPEHTIVINIIDNFFTAGDGRRNQNETSIRIILRDVNDNAPELPEDLSWSVSESLLEDVRVDPVSGILFAPDIDEPNTDNSRVGYDVLELEVTNRDVEVPDLFTTELIEHPDGNRARLQTLRDLRGFWGTYNILIEAYDHGHPQMNSTMWYPLEIRPFNFHDPVFQFPSGGGTIRLSLERAAPNSPLSTADNSVLDRIYATDEDGLDAGRVDFSIVGNAEAVEHFYIDNDAENAGTLMLLKVPENIYEFQITIRATDRGTEPGPRFTETTIRALMVPTIGDPVFQTRTDTVLFTEGASGLQQSHVLPHAEDPKNYGCTDDCRNIYYRINGGNTEGYFALDPIENRLSVQRELSRGAEDISLIIAASNSPDASGAAQDPSTLSVIVKVIEEDPKPVFVRELYTAGISTMDLIQKVLLTVEATHSLNDAITYTIDADSMQADPSLSSVRDVAFLLHPATGVLSLNMQPTASMHGMFEFNALATDTAANMFGFAGGEYATTLVKIFLISERNRVYFRFNNTVQAVEESKEFIAETFSSAFRMICNVDQVVPASDSNGAIIEDTADVLAHFIENDLPVPAEEIEPLRTDNWLLTHIQSILGERDLELQDLSTGVSAEGVRDPNELAVYVLGSLTALMALLCLILLVTFIWRTRTLRRRLNALSMARPYGSIDSGKNRAHIAPNTNMHAVEGSNPIYNTNMRQPDFDALSDMSDTSDLVGFEDLSQFRQGVANSSLDGSMGPEDLDERIATHRNDFGYHRNPNTNYSFT